MSKRKTFFEIVKQNNFEYQIEYQRLYELFNNSPVDYGDMMYGHYRDTLHSFINKNFTQIKFRKNALSLEDFDNENGLDFSVSNYASDEEYLITYCEYLINFLDAVNGWPKQLAELRDLIVKQIMGIMDKITFMPIEEDNIISFVPKNSAVIEVVENVEPSLAYQILSYNHHSFKGNIDGKKEILIKMASKLEPRESELRDLNPTIRNDIFYAFNNLNIRHNNSDPTDVGNYNEKFITMKDSDKEKLYDNIYCYCLEAFLELENSAGRKIIKELKNK